MSPLVLIVDDDLTTQALLQELMKNQGYIPIVCSDGKAAIEMLLSLEFQLVILDITLPEINGWDVFNYIHENIQRTCVLITTGTKTEKTESFKKKSYEYYDLLHKPFDSCLLDKVDELVEKSLTKRKILNNITPPDFLK